MTGRAAFRFKAEVSNNKRFNPHHAPAGSSKGGQFTHDPGETGMQSPEKAVDAEERKIISDKTETGIIISKNGEILITKRGDENKIYFDDSDAALLNGAIFTHNHPSGNSFSTKDFEMQRRTGIYELRAVGIKDGVPTRYSMIPDKRFYGLDPLVISKTVHNVNHDLRFEYFAAIRDKTLSVQDVNSAYSHELWTRISRRFLDDFGVDIGYKKEAI